MTTSSLNTFLEEKLKELEEFKCTGRYCNHETSEDHYIISKQFISASISEAWEINNLDKK